MFLNVDFFLIFQTITAVREILQALDLYNKSLSNHFSQEDKDYIKEMRFKIANIHDLRSMFVLLIRFYNPQVYNQQYLQDLVITNHILLTLLDDVAKTPDFKGFSKTSSMVDHIKE